MAMKLPAKPIATRLPGSGKTSQLKGKGKSGKAGKTAQAEGVNEAQQVHAADELVGAESLESSTAAPSSPLTGAVWEGLEQLASKYYGSADARDGLNVMLRARTEGGKVDLDKVVPSEIRELKASSLARETGLDKAAARELVDNLALLLAP